jgi:flagellar hook protein FlgE
MVFNTALSGIQSSSKDLEIIGNNIANSTTIGFKGSRAEFADIFTQNGSNSSVGGGVRMSRVHQSFATGNLTPTNNTLDLAIGGNGFFILSDQGATVYSRAGQFKLDEGNYIVNGSGARLQGLLASGGAVTGASGDLQVNTANIAPKATGTVNVGVNLYAKAVAPTEEWTGGAAPSSSSYNNVTSSTVYDSLGNSHVLSMYFIKAGDSSAVANAATIGAVNTTGDNQWYVAYQIDNVDVPAVSTSNSAGLQRINFNADGSFNMVEAPGTPPLSGFTPAGPITYTPANGADPLSITVDFTGSSQYGSPFAVQSLNNDGYTTGSLAGLDIDTSGVIYGRYTNGKSLAMGQIQLANFSDPESLKSLGNTNWSETFGSGQPVVSAAGTGGLGLVNSGSLEESNVDLTSELVKLISAQRNFQANAQTIRTADAITQTIINIR